MDTIGVKKESRYWAWEFPIALLIVAGTLVFAFGIPFLFQRSSNWATMFVDIGESICGVGVFYLARHNAIRAVSACLFVAGAAAFVFGLNQVY